MIRPDAVAAYATAATASLNRVLWILGLGMLDAKFPVKDGAVLANVPRRPRRTMYARLVNMPDTLSRTVAISAWCVYDEILSQVGRGEMINPAVLRSHTAALRDHAHMIEGANVVSLAERVMGHAAMAVADTLPDIPVRD
ncbi:hypothetical protein [Nonomuraea sp. CA-141351]|uniref:hypothetical protein n=1 Tax=Nonomuraea sp. CA-141351 TaxID=3239996 RepID=UPI003D903352